MTPTPFQTAHGATPIRDSIHAAFMKMGAPADSPLGETILIRNGLYCGRRFYCGELEATWFSEERQIKFFAADGSLSHVSKVDSSQSGEAA